MKLLTGLFTLTLLVSCGRVESPKRLFDFLDNTKQIEKNSERIGELERRINEQQNVLNGLGDQIGAVNVDQDMLTDLISSNSATLATLQVNVTVKEMIDPCGDNPNQFDEVLLVMTDGSIIGYFEQRGKRFLTQLPDGNFRTTDKQACNFSIVNGIFQD